MKMNELMRQIKTNNPIIVDTFVKANNVVNTPPYLEMMVGYCVLSPAGRTLM